MTLLRPGQSCEARFVGQFEREPDSWRDLLPNIGDCAVVVAENETIGRVRYFYVRCGLCGSLDYVPLDPRRSNPSGPQWSLTATSPVHLEPSVRVTHYEGHEVVGVCHYFVHGGRFEALADSTGDPRVTDEERP